MKENPDHTVSSESGEISDTAEVTFSRYDETLPFVALNNEVTSKTSNSGYYYAGDTVEFRTTGTVTADSDVALKHPVMSIILPPYTTLNTSLYEEDGVEGIFVRLSDGTGTILNSNDVKVSAPMEVVREVEIVNENGETETVKQTCWQYVLDFGEDFELDPGESIILEYGAEISLSLPSDTIMLNAEGTIGSAYQLPLTYENPTGMSYVQAPGDSSSNLDGDENSDDFIGDIDGDELNYLRQPVSINVSRVDSLIIRKYVAEEPGQWLGTGVSAVVEPAGTIYYQLQLVNAGTDVKEARFVDIIPFTGDTQEMRPMDDNGVLNSRSTSLPVSDDSHTYESVSLL